jgi:hypothetical protein
MRWALGVVTTLCLLTANAFAAVINFRDLAFSGAFDLPSFSQPVTVDGLSLTLTVEALQTDVSLPTGTLWWDATDGLGIRNTSGSYEDDEIEGSELFKLSFSTPVLLSQIFFTDLFSHEGGHAETGWYDLNGSGSPVTFLADPSQVPGSTNGERTLSFPPSEVQFITFSAPGKLTFDGWEQHHEFSVAGVDITPTPEPGTILLLGSGLASLGLLGRQKKEKTVKA